MEQTTSRLRKTFKYPTDNDGDSDDLPEAMDEEEQDTLISTLSAQNTSTNNTYRQILLLIPILSIIPYIPSLFVRSTTFLSLLSITSLLSTFYLLFSLPPTQTGFTFLDTLNSPKASSKHQGRSRSGVVGLEFDGDDGPVRAYLPILNLGLCVVLAVLGALVGSKVDVWMGFAWLPGAVYGVSVLAKWTMGSVDPEAELGNLRYGFKGA